MLVEAAAALAQTSAESSELTGLDPRQFWGVPVALIGAVFLSYGAQYQSRGLVKVEGITGDKAGSGLNFRHLRELIRRPSWVIGTGLLGLAVVFQLLSLTLSPLIVVQPLGVVAMVITAVLNAKMTGVKTNHGTRISIGMSVTGVAIFVLIASFTAKSVPVTQGKLITLLILFAVMLAVFGVLFLLFRKHSVALVYIIGAGAIYGFVATFAKAVIQRIEQGEMDWLTWLVIAALLFGAILGMGFVQNAYSSGPPDLVVAGLTVIDPLVAVLIGIVVLEEVSNAPLWAVFGFIISGTIAIIGVLGLAKYHPQVG
jgi:drug/metabolite transporter (DMT)-like permease